MHASSPAPAGLSEPGQSFLDTARAEVLQEVGVRVSAAGPARRRW